MEIQNIPLYKYFELSDRSQYDYLINYATDSKDIFNIGDFTLLKFGDVKELQLKFTKGVSIKDIIQFIVDLTCKEHKEVCSIKILDFIKVNNYVKNQIEFINTIEENNLVSPVDPDAEQAEVDRFDKFGYWIQIDRLALGDMTKYEAIKAFTYMDCFTKLLYEMEKDDYQKQLNKIQSRKHGKV